MPLAASDMNDETSLLQAGSALKTGRDRDVEDVLEDEAGDIKDFSKLGEAPKASAGCTLTRCFGTAPSCDAQVYDCISRGYAVAGWTDTCPGDDGIKCVTGKKVQCQYCPGGAQPAPFPKPYKLPEAWKEPPSPAPAPPPPPATPAPPMQMPTGKPVFAPLEFDSKAVNTTKKALAGAIANASVLKAVLDNATKLYATCEHNVTKARQTEAAEIHASQEARSQAVTYAKKTQLANITEWNTLKAMDSALWAEKGAAYSAQLNLAKVKDAGQKKKYYEKDLITAKAATKKAAKAAAIARAAVWKAVLDIRRAKGAQWRYDITESVKLRKSSELAAHTQALAEKATVQASMQSAFSKATLGSDSKKVPPYWQNPYWFPAK